MHLPGLDLLRAIAVIWVMLFHSFLVGGLGPDFEWLSRFGWMGVDIFFVLSGFLIGSQVLAPLELGEALSFSAFYARRAWRILPAFAAVLLVYVAAPSLREVPGLELWWKFATFTVNLLIDYGSNQAFSHAWSLCVEEHFYLVFPVLAAWMARRRSARGFLAVCAALVVAGIALRAAVWLHDAALDPPRAWFIEDIYYPTWMRLDGLLVGVMLAVLRVYRPQLWARLQSRSNAILLVGVAVLGLALVMFQNRAGLLANTAGWPVLSLGFGLLVFAGAGRGSLIGRWAVPGAHWIAAMSYSLYLSHKLAFHAVQVGLGSSVGGALRFCVFAVATLAVGAALHHLVERPFLRLRDRAPGRARMGAGPGANVPRRG